jgi:hypothetical protein
MVSQLGGQGGATIEQDFYVVGVPGLYGFSKHNGFGFLQQLMVSGNRLDGCF